MGKKIARWIAPEQLDEKMSSSRNLLVKDRQGNYKREFVGYACSYRLKLAFDFDSKQLAKVISAIADCGAKPELSIAFTVRNPSAVSEKLLISATENARAKAEILCKASGSTLGQLLNIDYNWGELNVYSRQAMRSKTAFSLLWR